MNLGRAQGVSKNYFAPGVRGRGARVAGRERNTATMNFWTPNLPRTGRFLRALTGLLAVGGGAVLLREGWALAGGPFVIFGAFCLFQAARGWCLARACGWKTPY